MAASLLSTDRLHLPHSQLAAELTPEWGMGACWYAAAHACQRLRARGITASYCQGWVIEEDGGITYCVSHAFLLDARGLVVDPHHHLLDLNPRWVVVNRWSYSALELHLSMARGSVRGGLPIGFHLHPDAMPDDCPRYRQVLLEALVAGGMEPAEVQLTDTFVSA
jgi:hypothetical protein